MKIYIFDDALLISGANLSHDYFTNRQDRYILIEDCKDLTDFYNNLVETVCGFSFRMNSNNDLNMDPTFPHHPYKSRSRDFVAEAKRRVEALFEKQKLIPFSKFNPESSNQDTWIFPLIQMGQLGVFMDNICTAKILEKAPPDAELYLATGYFNLTQDYMNSLLNVSQSNVHILMAHPSVHINNFLFIFSKNSNLFLQKANGFLGARGMAGGIPAGYTLLAYQFYRRLMDRAHGARIRLWEYQRQHWTFHAKGLWISFNNANDPRPCFTLIGSPNFGNSPNLYYCPDQKVLKNIFLLIGYRSVYKDLESQLAIVTVNSSLRDQLQKEREDLYRPSKLVDGSTFEQPDRKIPLWVRFIIKVFRRLF
nr:EOG090X08SX [Chydorus sphaericus]